MPISKVTAYVLLSLSLLQGCRSGSIQLPDESDPAKLVVNGRVKIVPVGREHSAPEMQSDDGYYFTLLPPSFIKTISKHLPAGSQFTAVREHAGFFIVVAAYKGRTLVWVLDKKYRLVGKCEKLGDTSEGVDIYPSLSSGEVAVVVYNYKKGDTIGILNPKTLAYRKINGKFAVDEDNGEFFFLGDKIVTTGYENAAGAVVAVKVIDAKTGASTTPFKQRESSWFANGNGGVSPDGKTFAFSYAATEAHVFDLWILKLGNRQAEKVFIGNSNFCGLSLRKWIDNKSFYVVANTTGGQSFRYKITVN